LSSLASRRFTLLAITNQEKLHKQQSKPPCLLNRNRKARSIKTMAIDKPRQADWSRNEQIEGK
jgi:hypothetical protein